MSFIKILSLESRLIIKSRWTIGIFVTTLILIFFSANTSYQFAKQGERTLEKIKEVQGENFKTWIREDEGAKPFREAIWGLHPKLKSNLFMALIAAVGPLMSIIWGASIIGSEFSWRTVKIRAAHYGWAKTIFAKSILILIGCFISVIFVSIFGKIINYLTWQYAIKNIEIAKLVYPPPVHVSSLMQILITVIGLSFYSLLGALLALICRNTAGGIVFGLAIPFVEQYAGKWWLPQTAYAQLLNKYIVYLPGSVINAPILSAKVSNFIFSEFALLAWIIAVIVALTIIPKNQSIN